MKRILSILLLGSLLLSLCACTAVLPDETLPGKSDETAPKDDLQSEIPREPVKISAVTSGQNAAVAEFAVRLVQSTYEKEQNNILSPESVLTALALVANGAKGQTLAQLEALFGMSMDEMNNLFATREMGEEFSSANAAWFREGFPVREEYLQKNTDYLGTYTCQAAFNEQTLTEINAWVSEHTKQRISHILDALPTEAQMVLVNALTFDAKWQTPYTDRDIMSGVFHGTAGNSNVAMLCSQEGLYLNDGKATGFVKYYEGRRYAFAALLPNEGVSMQDYLAGLTGESLLSTLQNAQFAAVITKMPTLKTECCFESLTEALRNMGVSDVFDSELSDLSGISENPLYVSNIVHKTFLQIDAEGTKAAAVTGTILFETTGVVENPKTVILDRPYLLVIYDTESSSILFCGTINNA